MTVPAEQLSKLSVDYTIVGGKIMYDRERDGLIEPLRGFGGENDGQ